MRPPIGFILVLFSEGILFSRAKQSPGLFLPRLRCVAPHPWSSFRIPSEPKTKKDHPLDGSPFSFLLCRNPIGFILVLFSEGILFSRAKQSPGLFLPRLWCVAPHPWSSFRIPSEPKKKKDHPLDGLFLFGVPEGIRTPDLLIRSQTLYPAELQAHLLSFWTA